MEALKAFGIQRSLSNKGWPCDNEVAEATFIKTELANQRQFKSLEQLNLELWDYIHGYNHHRLHGTLKCKNLYFLSSLVLTIQTENMKVV